MAHHTLNKYITQKVYSLSLRYAALDDGKLVEEVLFHHNEGEVIFYLIYGRYLSSLENVFIRLSKQEDCFPDLLAELELHLLKDDCRILRSFKKKSSLKTWLIRVAHNLFINLLPKMETFYSKYCVPEEGNVPDTIKTNTNDITLLSFRQAVSLLPSTEQRIVLMKEAEGYNSSEIAAMLTARRNARDPEQQGKQVSVDNVYKMRQRAIAYLKDLMAKERDRIAEEEAHLRFRMCNERVNDYEQTAACRYKPHFIKYILSIKKELEDIS